MKQPNTTQNRIKLKESMQTELETNFQEYIKLEKTLTTKSEIQKATDDFVIQDTEIKTRYIKLSRSRTMEII